MRPIVNHKGAEAWRLGKLDILCFDSSHPGFVSESARQGIFTQVCFGNSCAHGTMTYMCTISRDFLRFVLLIFAKEFS